MKRSFGLIAIVLLVLAFSVSSSRGVSDVYGDKIFDTGAMKPVDSVLKVKAGEEAPDFTLPSLSRKDVSLSDYKGKKNVVISFVPAAWTPVCSDQWPGYNLAKGLFEKYDAILLGVSVDNLPTLHAWTREMGGLWFPVLSDFWPHGQVAERYGVLRSDGTSERAIFVIDKKGVVRLAYVSDINKRPDLKIIMDALQSLE